MGLALGKAKSGKVIGLTDEERSRHIHVIGASGSGKSKLLEALLRQDIKVGRGLCLIDPHGTLADDIIQWCAATGMDRFRRIHVVEPSDLNWAVGFNPLRDDGRTAPALRVDAMVSACAQVWGGEDTSSTPLLKKCLRAVFYALAVRNLTLVEAPYLTTSSDVLLRRTLTDNLPDSVFDAVWRDFEGLPRREFFEQFSSTNNRMLEFLSSPIVRRVIGQRDHALDLRAVMDGGEILIVNLKPGDALSADNARLLGTLLTTELFLLALTRDQATAKRRPFTLYIDECYNYLTADVERMLDQTRKFGLHVVLSHHRLGQLRARSEAIFNGVMAGGQTKIVFGGLTDEDADIMAREVMRTSINLERPKHVLDKPVVVDEVPFWLESSSWSTSESTTLTEGESSSWGSVASGSDGLSQSFDRQGVELGSVGSWGASWTESNGHGSASSVGKTAGSSQSRGFSQTLKPVRQMMPTSVYSLEEEFHLATVKLRELPRGAAIVKRPGKFPVRVRTEIIKPALASAAKVETFVNETRVASPYLSVVAVADAEITTRQKALGARADPPIEQGSDPFWNAEDE